MSFPLEPKPASGSPLFSVTYDFEEDGSQVDNILDPGERANVNFGFDDGLTFTSVRYGYFSGTTKVYNNGTAVHANGTTSTVGVAGDWPDPLIYLEENTTITGTSITLPYTLLEGTAKSNDTFFIETTMDAMTRQLTPAPVTMTYGFQLNELENLQLVDLNGQIEEVDGFEGYSSSDFSRIARSDPGLIATPPSPSGVQLWNFGTTWVCNAPSSPLENELHTLTTPILDLRPDATLEFSHQTFFSSLQEGGFIEYQTYFNSSVLQSWQNIATLALNPQNLYDASLYSGGNSQLSQNGFDTWVNGLASEQMVRIPLNDTFLGSANQIAFRFVYQAPGDDPTGSDNKWSVRDIKLIYEDLRQDNIFKVDMDITLDLCATNGNVILLNSSPYNENNFDYTWYGSKTDLYQGIVLKGKSRMPQTIRESRSYQQYVEMELIGSPQFSTRIHRLTVSDGPEYDFCDLFDFPQFPQAAITLWPNQMDITILLTDYLLCATEQGDDCKSEYFLRRLHQVEGPAELSFPRTSVSYDLNANLFSQSPLGTSISRAQNEGFISFALLEDWNQDQNGKTLVSTWINNTQLTYNSLQNAFVFDPNDPGLSKIKSVPSPSYSAGILRLCG